VLKDLVKVANKLDSLGFQREADVIDTFIKEVLDERGINYIYHWNVNWSKEPDEYDIILTSYDQIKDSERDDLK
jgi:hypothetical protein